MSGRKMFCLNCCSGQGQTHHSKKALVFRMTTTVASHPCAAFETTAPQDRCQKRWRGQAPPCLEQKQQVKKKNSMVHVEGALPLSCHARSCLEPYRQTSRRQHSCPCHWHSWHLEPLTHRALALLPSRVPAPCILDRLCYWTPRALATCHRWPLHGSEPFPTVQTCPSTQRALCAGHRSRPSTSEPLSVSRRCGRSRQLRMLRLWLRDRRGRSAFVRGRHVERHGFALYVWSAVRIRRVCGQVWHVQGGPILLRAGLEGHSCCPF